MFAGSIKHPDCNFFSFLFSYSSLLLLSMRLPEEAISALPMKHRFEDAGDFDLVIRDLTGQDDTFVLLDYALNLSPALRDSITRDIAQNVSRYEPRVPWQPPPTLRSFLGRPTPEQAPDPRCLSLRKNCVESKAAYLLKPPKAPK